MGAISSCFGRGRSPEESDDETRRLLQNPFQTGYGGIQGGGGVPGGEQPTTEAARREQEALEGICHSLSDGVFDIFTASQHQQHQREGHLMQEPDAPVSPRILSDRNTSRVDDEDDLASEEMRLRTIKKGRSGPVFSSMNKSRPGIGAVQAAIG